MSSKPPLIGELLDDGPAERDAIHIAIAPVYAGEDLMPGQHVGLLDNGEAAVCGTPVGVVDPYLTTTVGRGERFWLFIYPNTITSLRHEWVHPAFQDARQKSMDWIQGFASQIGMDYERLMAAAHAYAEFGEYASDNTEGYKRIDDLKWPVFWRHFQTVTGKKVQQETDGAFFTCGC